MNLKNTIIGYISGMAVFNGLSLLNNSSANIIENVLYQSLAGIVVISIGYIIAENKKRKQKKPDKQRGN